MKLIAFAVIVLLGFTACQFSEQPPAENTGPDTVTTQIQSTQDTIANLPETDTTNQTEAPANSRYSFKITPSPHGGFGYEIYDGSVLFINQPHIPAVSGMNGFSTKDKAQKTAEYAISKMEAGFIPPTLSKAELDSLGVLK